MKNFIICWFISLYSISSFACKDPIFGVIYPIHAFTDYSNVVTAKIISSKTNKSLRYNPLVSLEATVISNIKGNLPLNAKINIHAKEEDTRAVCPLRFNDNQIYLLLLERTNNQLSISRFSFPINSNSVFFDSYINQITSIIKNE